MSLKGLEKRVSIFWNGILKNVLPCNTLYVLLWQKYHCIKLLILWRDKKIMLISVFHTSGNMPPCKNAYLALLKWIICRPELITLNRIICVIEQLFVNVRLSKYARYNANHGIRSSALYNIICTSRKASQWNIGNCRVT